MRNVASVLGATICLVATMCFAEEIQVSLRADKAEYALNETINLSYETLWLGSGDGNLAFSSLAFPELEILYLNTYPVEMTVVDRVVVRSEPSRHEQAMFAPTMSRTSDYFPINSESPTRYLDGRVGYYNLDRPGAYVVRAVFKLAANWKLYVGQESDIRSNALVIRIVE